MVHAIELPTITEDMIQDISRRIVAEFNPDKVILFGSQAYGTPHGQSDIDLLRIMESDRRPVERALPILRACRPRFVAMDILVRTPAEIAERLAAGDPFFHEVTSRGRVLYERAK